MKRQNPTMFFHLIFLLVIIPLKAEGARTCLEQAQLAGVVFGTSLATVVLIIFVAYLLLYVYKRRLKGDQDGVLEKVRDPEKSAYENPTCETEEKGTDPMVIPREDKMTNCHSLRQRNRRQNIQLFRHHRSKSSDSITTLKDMFRTLMEDRDINGLGFTICGSQNEGIFVANVHPKGPAGRCGNILSGDRIKGVSISFDSMVFEDALTILSAASLYKVKLELERQVSDEMDSVSVDKQATLERPLYQRAPQPERPPTMSVISSISLLQ
ncbi:hypothetical protein AB6A40_006782 [Gnathostoma spinigerum]|uniref:PDZ domain-containing protein n=1 Tax=Gnathostoma spinigerum TaxID=75299 RepID=A0ABD6EJK6_9BILA